MPTAPDFTRLKVLRALALKARIDMAKAALPPDQVTQFADDFAAADAMMSGVGTDGVTKIDPATLAALLQFLMQLLTMLLPLIPHG